MEGKQKVSRIIPLSLPRGTEKLCEVCQKRAKLMCQHCRVTFYCDAQHQRADWVGIHERICQLLVPIRSATLTSRHGAAHTEMQLKKEELIDICRTEAQRKLAEKKYLEALPAAQLCLRCSIDVHGPSSAQVVPGYLLLAEANMGLGNLGLVSELQAQAEWVVLKSPDCGHRVRQQLQRSLGLRNMATGNLDAALHNFATYVYFASEEFGPDSTVACHGLFLMANVFAKQGKTTITQSLYSTVTETWHLHLTNLVEAHIEKSVRTPDGLPYDKSQQTEVEDMLKTIVEFEKSISGTDPSQTALTVHALAMLCFLKGDHAQASGFGSAALQAVQLIPNHHLTESVRALLQLLQPNHPTSG